MKTLFPHSLLFHDLYNEQLNRTTLIKHLIFEKCKLLHTTPTSAPSNEQHETICRA